MTIMMEFDFNEEQEVETVKVLHRTMLQQMKKYGIDEQHYQMRKCIVCAGGYDRGKKEYNDL